MRINKLGKILFVALLVAALLAAVPAAAEEPASSGTSSKAANSSDDWRFGFALYGYLAAIGGELENGKDFDVGFDDILDNLDFALMGMGAAFKGKWSFMADVIYMDVQADKAATLSLPLTSRITVNQNVKADMEMQSWIVTPTVGYELLDRDKFQLSVTGGLRYMWIKTKLEVKRSNRFRYRENKVSDSQSNWDGVVGVRGQILLNDKWYLPYYADVGTGDSDLTWQVFGGLGYRFKHFDLVGGYRHMQWDFDNDYIIDNMYVSGPMIGAVFMF